MKNLTFQTTTPLVSTEQSIPKLDAKDAKEMERVEDVKELIEAKMEVVDLKKTDNNPIVTLNDDNTSLETPITTISPVEKGNLNSCTLIWFK